VRRRRHEEASAGGAEPLQLVETAGDKIAASPVFEDEAIRRPVRRRRQSQPTPAPEPLQLVETAPGATNADGNPPQA
jgi:hypothetical protein